MLIQTLQDSYSQILLDEKLISSSFSPKIQDLDTVSTDLEILPDERTNTCIPEKIDFETNILENELDKKEQKKNI